MLARALDVIFPQRCAGCGAGPWPFCAHAVPPSRRSIRHGARRCGRPKALSVPRCRDCPPPEIDTARAPFRFEGPARQAIHRLKFSGWRGVGSALSSADGRGRRAAERRRGDLGAARTAATRRARVRPGAGPGDGCGTPNGDALRGPAHQGAVATGPQAQRDAVARRMAMRGAFAVGDRVEVPSSRDGGRRRPDDGRYGSRCGAGVAAGGSDLGAPGGGRRAFRAFSGVRPMPILERALVRVCGCPEILSGSRRQPRAKRPT